MATKTITVTLKSGQLAIDRPTVNLTQNQDKVKVKNLSGSTVYWFVPFGALKGGGFHIAVRHNKTTGDKEAERHSVTTQYTHRITLDPNRRLRKHGPKSDPIIIIDIER